MCALSIQLEAVKESPARFPLDPGEAWWADTRERLREPEAELSSPFLLDLTGYRIGARLLFRGEVTGGVKLACGRCAEPYDHGFREPVELLLEPASAGDEVPEGGIELDPEDPGLGRYAGEELDFAPVLLEILALAWPMQPRCAEGCRGLCPVCGTNLNQQSCGCETRSATSPFADLGRMLEESKRTRR